jgi:hypothetical protein
MRLRPAGKDGQAEREGGEGEEAEEILKVMRMVPGEGAR